MITVHKYILDFNSAPQATVFIPQGGEILDCQVQDADIVIWARVNTDLAGSSRGFRMFDTGESMGTGPVKGWQWQHLATLQLHGGRVGHIFEGVLAT